MKISKPLELKDKDLTIENLSMLDFIEIIKMKNGYIIKMKLSGRFSKFKDFMSFNEIGEILQDKKTGKYYFMNESGNLKHIFKLDNWGKIKLFMESLK